MHFLPMTVLNVAFYMYKFILFYSDLNVFSVIFCIEKELEKRVRRETIHILQIFNYLFILYIRNMVSNNVTEKK